MTTSAFSRALKAKYGNPRAVLRRLGLDDDLLGRKALVEGATGNGDSDLRTALEKTLAEICNRIGSDWPGVAELHALLDQYPTENAAMDQDDRIEKFKALLREKGLSEDDIMGACDLLPVGEMPGNGTAGGAGGALSGRAADHMRRMAHDSADREQARASFEGRFPEATRVTSDIGDQAPARPPPSGAGVSDLAKNLVGRISTGPF